MKRRTRSLLGCALLLVAAVALVVGYVAFGPKTHKVLAQGIPPTGSFGFLINQWGTAPVSPAGTIGVVNFDGAGGVTGSFTTYHPQSPPPLETHTFTGSYSSNPDGTGSISVTDNTGVTIQFAMVISNGGSRISLLQTSGNLVVTGVANQQ